MIICILDIVVQSINIFVECVRVIMDFQVPLLIIDRSDISIMSAYPQTCKVIHLTFDIARIVMRYSSGPRKNFEWGHNM
jgi:hypothetical protein